MAGFAFNFKLPTEIEFGPGALKLLPEKIRSYTGGKVMLVTDPGVAATGILQKITNLLEAAGISFVVFDKVEPDPSTDTIGKIANIANSEQVELLVAIGGGSSIDASKGTGILLTNGGKLQDYAGVGKVKKRGIPLIAIPTTAGTGSEVTIFAVLSDVVNDLKFTVTSPLQAPVLALLDPELTLSLPPSLTAATGMDAMTHAVEAYTSLISQPISDVLALEAIRLIYRYLPEATNAGSSILARTEMLKAQLLAGVAFSNAFLGLSHAIASPLGGHYHIPHGVANAIMLPYVMKYNYAAAPEKYAQMAQAMGLALDGKDIYEDAYKAVTAIEKLVALCGLPTKLKHAGATEDKLDAVAKDALLSTMLKFNCRTATEKQIRQIVQEAF